jgi:hypothetical protein
MKCIAALTLLLTTLTSAAAAQTGVLDQSNPYPPPPPTQTAGFNGGTPSLIWQQEVQTGVAGQLEGVNVYLNGAVGASFNLRLRAGAGFSSSPALFQTLVTKTSAAPFETVFVNCSAANLQFAQGALFVIEIQGNDTGAGFLGTYTPPPTAPAYPRPLFLGSSTCYADCGWRLSFDTFMLTTPAPTNYCTAGTTTNGCNATISASAQPSASQATPCTLTVANVEGQKQGLVFYGLDNTGFTPLPWATTSTSFFCVKSPTQRTFPQTSGGVANQCNGVLSVELNNFFGAFPSALGLPFATGDKLYVQAWFRDPPAPRTTNLSNAIELTMKP